METGTMLKTFNFVCRNNQIYLANSQATLNKKTVNFRIINQGTAIISDHKIFDDSQKSSGDTKYQWNLSQGENVLTVHDNAVSPKNVFWFLNDGQTSGPYILNVANHGDNIKMNFRIENSQAIYLMGANDTEGITFITDTPMYLQFGSAVNCLLDMNGNSVPDVVQLDPKDPLTVYVDAHGVSVFLNVKPSLTDPTMNEVALKKPNFPKKKPPTTPEEEPAEIQIILNPEYEPGAEPPH